MTTVLEQKINNFTCAVKKAIQHENWYAALAIALTLPDICGKLQNPSLGSTKRYIGFFNDFLKPKYVYKIGALQREHEFLNGNDMYALRCSFLHSGTVDISSERIQEALNKYAFLKPDKVNRQVVHMNQIGNTLQLQIDKFCLEVIAGVDIWLKSYKNDEEIQARANSMIDIIDPSNGVRI